MLLLSCTFISGQEQKEFKNEVRWVTSSLVLGRTQFAYERALGKIGSISASIGLHTGNGIEIKGISNETLYISGLQYESGMSSNIEYRYYFPSTTKKSLDGFYAGVYTSFISREASSNGWYKDESDNSSDFNMNAKLKTWATGINLGYKLRVWKNLTADFTILGPGITFNKLDLNFDSQISQETIDQIRQAITDRYNYLGDKLPEFKASNGNQNFRTDFKFFSFRYGVGIGYSF